VWGGGLPDLVAKRGLDLKFSARLEAELNIVLHRAGNPPFLRYPGDGGKAHTRRAADDFEDRCNGVGPLNSLDVAVEVTASMIGGHAFCLA
jgi:hypothetical protein